MKMCRHPQDAEDVLQDSMLALSRAPSKIFGGASSFSTWLFTIARSFCIKKRRKSKFAPKREESLDHMASAERLRLESAQPDPHAQVQSAELWQQVRDAIAVIEPAYREVLVLRDIEGLRAKEVAEVGISVSAVKSRLHRARTQLRERLARAPYRPQAGCPNIRQVFSQHLEGDLSRDICATMESHVAQCPICAQECDGLKAALNACVSAPCNVPVEVQTESGRPYEILSNALIFKRQISTSRLF